MQHEFVFSGFGGQGVMFVGQLLAYAALDEGLQVTWIPSYGPEMRGGTAHCFVVISDQQIGSPMVAHPRHAVVFNNPSFDKYENKIASGGVLVVNGSLVTRAPTRTDITTLVVPATDLADSIGDLKQSNLVLLGALLTASPVISLEAARRALDSHSRRREKLPSNFLALEAGAQAARKEGVGSW